MLELEDSYQKTKKKYLLELFEEWDPGHLKQINEDYPHNDGLDDIIRDEGVQNLNNDD